MTDEERERLEAARKLREMAAREPDQGERERLTDSAAEHEGLSLTGDAGHRARPADS